MSDIKSASLETIIVSRVGETPIILELECTKEAFSRIGEIAIINPITMPDLMACFNKALVELNKAAGTISLEIVKATKAVDRRKAIIITEEMPTILATKNLKSSEDVRSAVLALDDLYSNLLEQKHSFEALFENIKSKTKSIEMALYNIRTIVQYRAVPKYTFDDASNRDFGPGEVLR